MYIHLLQITDAAKLLNATDNAPHKDSFHLYFIKYYESGIAQQYSGGYEAEGRGWIPSRGKKPFSCLQRPDRLWVHPASYVQWVPGALYPGGRYYTDGKLTTHHLVLRPRMVHHTSSWCGA
jgi:hypothetical protein